MKTNFKYFICSILMLMTLGYSMEAGATETRTNVKINGINYILYHDDSHWDGSQCVDFYEATVSKSDAFDYTGNIIIPETVTHEGKTYPVMSVGSEAFKDCADLTSVVLPNNVTNISNYAFQNCVGLKSINIPEKVTYLGESAFNGCTSLKNIELSDGITSLPSYCFQQCTALETIKLPARLETIYYNCFSECSSLRALTIPETVTQIHSTAFYECHNLKSIYISNLPAYCNIFFETANACPLYNDGDLYLNGQKVTNLVIPDNVSTIPAYAFYHCTSITAVSIPNTTKIIGYDTFGYCPNLQKVTLPKSIKRIDEFAFIECRNLKETYIEDLDAFCAIAFKNTSSSPLNNGSALYVKNELVTNLTIPTTISNIKKGVFSGCTSITDLTIPATVTNIGSNAFSGCTNLKSVHAENLAAFLNIDLESAFSSPLSLRNTKLFVNGKAITNLVVPVEITTIKPYTFANNSSLTAVTLHKDVTSIGKDAFNYHSNGSYAPEYYKEDSSIDTLYVEDLAAFHNIDFANAYSNPLCHGAILMNQDQVLNEITVPAAISDIKPYTFYGVEGINKITLHEGVKSIGESAFSGNNSPVILKTVTPPAIASEITNGVIIVPSAALNTYMTANKWSDWKLRIYPDNTAFTVATVTAQDKLSDLHRVIGEENLQNVFNLKVIGTLNSYDVMVIRAKMLRLKEIDLSEANFVSCDYPYYSYSGYDYATKPDTITPYMFYQQQFNKIILPKSVRNIGHHAFADNDGLKHIDFPKTLQTIGESAFYNCDGLEGITLPDNVTRLGESAFAYCDNLQNVHFSKELTTIGYNCFSNCYQLKTIKLPTSLKNINGCAFLSCTNLQEVRIPSSVRYVGQEAFASCDNVQKVYTYTIEPTHIQQQTFSCWNTATLYVPKTSYYTYYYNTQWHQFAKLAEFDEPYENFYVNGDYELNDETGRVDGTPDVEMGDNSGLIVDGNEVQKTDTLEVEHDGENGGSIIGGNGNGNGDGNIHANKLLINIKVEGGRWYFFCFPFQVPRSDVWCKHTKDFVFRYYDGDDRANGLEAWEDVIEDYFDEDEGYIFQCAQNDTLVVSLDNVTFNDDDDWEDLMEYLSEDLQNASWNFKGNPFLSYYNIKDMDYNAPITVWDGYNYVAYNPQDDDYQLAPFEAFFVQKPTGVNRINFSGQKKSTYQKSQRALKAAKAKRALMKTNPSRLLTNLTISNGNATDQTRIVFNDQRKMNYEMECDAAKFMSSECSAQIYSIDANQAQYAINERPNAEGAVAIGYVAQKDGNYTISAPRMDVPMYLRDEVNGITFDLRLGDYHFDSKAGTFNNRFTLLKNNEPTSIEDLLDKTGVEMTAQNGQLSIQNSNNASITVYNMGGQTVATQQGDGIISLAKNNYIVKIGGLAVKLSMK